MKIQKAIQHWQWILLICLGQLPAFATDRTDSLQSVLKNELSKKSLYDQQKEHRIRLLKQKLTRVAATDTNAQFDVNSQLYGEYASYKYDSAYVYAERLLRLSKGSQSVIKQNLSKSNISFVLLSSGKFREAFAILPTINSHVMDSVDKVAYYSLMSRAYLDNAAYDNDQRYSPAYRVKGNLYLDSALAFSQPGSYSKAFLTSYQHLKTGNDQAAINGFLQLLKTFKSTVHQNAITYSLLSQLYRRNKQTELATTYLIRAVIGDLQTATKETSALFELAELASKQQNVNDAYLYIQEALKDAEFYGARQRQVQISTILPLLAAQKLNATEIQKQRFLILLCSALLILSLIAVISIMLYKQLQQRKAREMITAKTNRQLEELNQQLRTVNQQLLQANHKLDEDAHIKEEYIGYFFNIISGYILKLEKLKNAISTKIIQRKYEQISPLVNEIQIQKDREDLFKTFDQVFLKMFPNFISAFNSLFNKENQIWPKEQDSLTTDLRIFALIRLGIDESETIAKILEYSAKTIYVYKMRLKAKSLYPPEEFDQRLMSIKITTPLAADPSLNDNNPLNHSKINQ